MSVLKIPEHLMKAVFQAIQEEPIRITPVIKNAVHYMTGVQPHDDAGFAIPRNQIFFGDLEIYFEINQTGSSANILSSFNLLYQASDYIYCLNSEVQHEAYIGNTARYRWRTNNSVLLSSLYVTLSAAPVDWTTFSIRANGWVAEYSQNVASPPEGLSVWNFLTGERLV